MAQNPFVGTWRLVSFEYRRTDGQVTHPFGHNPIGYIMYNDDGYMFVAFMRDDRPRFTSNERIWEGTTEEKLAAANTFISYCGRYEIVGNKVIHHVEVSLFPNWVGADQERFFQFADNKLTLTTTPFTLRGIEQVGQLVWERV